jgi:hypothetical protein
MPHRTLAEQVRGGFPGAVRATDLVDRLADRCTELGFLASSSLLIVGVCRDELCFPFVARLEDTWGPAFHVGSLGGLVTIGRTGISAAFGHAPEDPGAPRRYLVVAGPHMGMDETGEFGTLRREHQAADSRACGALMAFRDELLGGHVDLGYDPNDPEMSLLRQRLVSSLAYGTIPDPVQLTRHVAQLIDEDLAELIRWRASARRDTHEVRVAVVTGVLVHTSGGDWFEPHRSRFWSSRSGDFDLDLGDPGPD